MHVGHRAAYGHRRSLEKMTRKEQRAAAAAAAAAAAEGTEKKVAVKRTRTRSDEDSTFGEDGVEGAAADKVRALLYFSWTSTSIVVESEKAEASRVWFTPRTVDRSGLRAEPVRHSRLNKNLDLCVRKDRKIYKHGSKQAKRHLGR